MREMAVKPVLPQTLEAFTRKFEPFGFRPQAFMPCYGMAESVLFVGGLKSLSEPPKVLSLSATDLEKNTVRMVADTENGQRQVVSCGKPGYGHRVIAVDPVTRTLAEPGRIGELWIQGPSVPDGYWGLAEESRATFQGRLAVTDEGPFLRTGDLGFIAEEEIYLTGRLKDLIIIAGKNHYPTTSNSRCRTPAPRSARDPARPSRNPSTGWKSWLSWRNWMNAGFLPMPSPKDRKQNLQKRSGPLP